MALDLGSFGLPLVTSTPIVPFHNGMNQFNNQPPFNANQYPWQPDQQSIWQLVQRNGQNIQNPFNFQQNQNNTNTQQNQNNTNGDDKRKQWQMNRFNLNQEQEKNNTESQGGSGSQSQGDGSQSQNEASKSSEEKEESAGSKDDENDEEDEALEEAQEKFEEWLEDMDEEKKQLYKDFQVYTILFLPFLLYERTTANYFAATELMSIILEKLGLNDDDNLAFMLFVQCVDLVALTRGRFVLVEGYKQNWYQELYDYTLTKLDVHDAIRLGTQMIMPQSPAPEYETR